jgi:DUF2075 family protein
MPTKGKSVVCQHIEMEGKVYSLAIGVTRCDKKENLRQNEMTEVKITNKRMGTMTRGSRGELQIFATYLDRWAKALVKIIYRFNNGL